MKFVDPAGEPLLQAVYDDGDEVIIAFTRWLAEAPRPADWHRFALGANWDFVTPELFEWIALQDACEKATALALFWQCSPDFFLEFRGDRSSIPVSVEVFDLQKLIRERWLNGEYRSATIAFDRDVDLWPMDFDALAAQHGDCVDEDLPLSMRQSIPGRRLDTEGLIDGIPRRFWPEDCW